VGSTIAPVQVPGSELEMVTSAVKIEG